MIINLFWFHWIKITETTGCVILISYLHLQAYHPEPSISILHFIQFSLLKLQFFLFLFEFFFFSFIVSLVWISSCWRFLNFDCTIMLVDSSFRLYKYSFAWSVIILSVSSTTRFFQTMFFYCSYNTDNLVNNVINCCNCSSIFFWKSFTSHQNCSDLCLFPAN